MGKIISIIYAALFIAAVVCNAAPANEIQPVRGGLGRYNIDIHQSSVSGLSAGGFFANQFFVAYSGIMRGVGVFAGGPYGCARGDVFKALSDCMARPYFLTDDVMTKLADNARAYSGDKRIDPLKNLKSKKIFLFGGTADKTVRPDVVARVYDWYLNMGVGQNNIFHKKDMMAGHAMPTVSYGNKCEEPSSPPWMSACKYDGAGEALKHIYGSLNPPQPVTSATGQLIEFVQKEFVEPQPLNAEQLAEQTSLNEFGYAYVPRSCAGGEPCRIHIVFHGCRQVYNKDPAGIDPEQGGKPFGLQMVLHAGYNEWANTNHMIVLYPQAQKNKVNPNGCFDWWGYLDGTKDTYATKGAPQMKTVRAMLKALSGK